MRLVSKLERRRSISIDDAGSSASPELPVFAQTVLAVDDTPENLTLLTSLLKGKYRVKVATNGKRALQVATKPPFPDIILLDVVMPGIDGYEVCRRLKQERDTRDIPVIFLTARSDVVDEEIGFKVGAVDYITKPISPSVVMARVETHLALKGARDFLKDRNAFLEQEVERRVRDVLMIQDVAQLTYWHWRPGRPTADERLNENLGVYEHSSGAKAIFGTDPVFCSANFRDQFIHSEDKGAARGAYLAFLTSKQDSMEISYRIVRPDGSCRFIHEICQKQRDNDGRTVEITGTLRDITDLRHKETELATLQNDLQALFRQLGHIRELERKRLAREIHDGVGQSISAIRLSLQCIARQSGPHYDAILEEVERAATGLKEMVVDLRSAELASGDPGPALDRLAKRFARATSVTIDASEVGSVFLGEQKAEHVFRIAQEALNNAVRHSRANRISLSLKLDGNTCVMSVVDDGVGIARSSPDSRGGGYGMTSMAERANTIHAELKVLSEPNQGTRVELRVSTND